MNRTRSIVLVSALALSGLVVAPTAASASCVPPTADTPEICSPTPTVPLAFFSPQSLDPNHTYTAAEIETILAEKSDAVSSEAKARETQPTDAVTYESSGDDISYVAGFAGNPTQPMPATTGKTESGFKLRDPGTRRSDWVYDSDWV